MNDKVAGELIDQVSELKKDQSDLKYIVKDLNERMDQFYKVERAQDNINDWTVKCISNLCKGWIATTIAIIGLAILILFFK